MFLILPQTYGDAATNMAMDAALLQTIPVGFAAFRHYGWTESAMTFGYTQKLAEIQRSVSPEIKLCRRITGGGAVDHRNDWTYSLTIHADHAVARSRSTELYQILHLAIRDCIEAQGIACKLAPCHKQCGFVTVAQPLGTNYACFDNPVANDVVLPNGTKIAGAAMKRSRSGILIQGSIDRGALPATFNFPEFAGSLPAKIALMIDTPTDQLDNLEALFGEELIQKEKERFSSDEWTARK